MSQLTDLFSSIANAIRGKTGSVDAIPASGFATAIAAIPAGSEVVFTQVTLNPADYASTGKVVFSIAFPDAVGKDNIVAFIVQTDNYQSLGGISHSNVPILAVVNNEKKCAYADQSSSNGTQLGWGGSNVNWDKASGVISLPFNYESSRIYQFSGVSNARDVLAVAVAW